MRQILSNRGALASTLKACGFAAAELKQAVEAIDGKVESSQQVETTEDMSRLIERVEFKREGMLITLNLRALLPADRFSAGGADLRMTRTVPLQMRRRGKRSQFRGQIRLCSEHWHAATSGSPSWRREQQYQPGRLQPEKV